MLTDENLGMHEAPQDPVCMAGSPIYLGSQEECQSAVDEASAEGFEAGEEYVRTRKELEWVNAELARERSVQFHARTSLASSPRMSFPPVSPRVIELEKQRSKLEEELRNARGRLDEAIVALESLCPGFEKKSSRAATVSLPQASPLFSENLENATEVWQAEAAFFRGLVDQIEDVLQALARSAAAAGLVRRSQSRRLEEDAANSAGETSEGEDGEDQRQARETISPWKLVDLPRPARGAAPSVGADGMRGDADACPSPWELVGPEMLRRGITPNTGEKVPRREGDMGAVEEEQDSI